MWLGRGFCDVGSRIFQEVWVSNSAWLLGRNGAWECGFLIGVSLGVWDGMWAWVWEDW